MGGREGGILASRNPAADAVHQPLGLYAHLPFCSSRCAYCDFHSLVFDHELAGPLFQAINFQLTQLNSLYKPGNRTIDTIFLGGGTPSIWPTSQLAELLNNISRHFSVAQNAEITLEANPDSLDPTKLKDLRAAGYNRLSLGVQSFNERNLKLLGRKHRPGQIYRAADWARAAGFSNLSLDIIYGLPFQSIHNAGGDVAGALELSPQHLSLYQLTLNPGTKLGQKYTAGQHPMPDEHTILAMEEQALGLCRQAGLMQYEISNYARPGLECRHNAATWQGADYLALGPGAHGHLAGRRWANLYDLPAYIAAWQPGGGQAMEFDETLSPKQRAAELFMLGLRTARGVDLRQISAIIGSPAIDIYAQAMEFLHKQGWAKINGDFLRPTGQGLKMADRAALEFV